MTTELIFRDSAGSIEGFQSASIDYSSGAVSLTPYINGQWTRATAASGWQGRFTFQGWEYHPFVGQIPLDQSMVVTYAYGNTGAQITESHALSALAIDLVPGTLESALPGSLRLTLGDEVYADLDGAVYHDISPATGAGVLAGSLDYASSRLTLTDWAEGATSAPQVNSLLTRLSLDVVDEVTFRAPASPVQVGSVYIQATDIHGAVVSATANNLGVFDDDGIEGRMDYDSGVGHVRFGEWVAAAGNEAEPWYDAANVVGGQIWRPRWVIAETIRYNCVTISYLPIDADQLGMEPERLPGDGRVPIFQPGTLAVIHHTGTVGQPTPTPGGAVALGRDRLARVWVRDGLNQKLPGNLYRQVNGVETLIGAANPAAKWRANLDTGAFAWLSPLSLTGFQAPYTIHHRIHHKSRVREVDISGRIVLRQPLNHTYPSGSFVSSALVIGDLQGRVSLLPFAQTTWTGAWSNALIGDEPLAQFNPQFPVQPTNNAQKDRYALRFVTASTFHVYGESRGLLTASPRSINEDFGLYNPLTGDLEFTIPHQALSGGGWSAGNVVRFNIEGGNHPFQVALTVLEGPSTSDLDSFTLEFMGDTQQ